LDSISEQSTQDKEYTIWIYTNTHMQARNYPLQTESNIRPYPKPEVTKRENDALAPHNRIRNRNSQLTSPQNHIQALATWPSTLAIMFFTFCFCAHSRLATRPFSAAAALALRAASSFSRLSDSAALRAAEKRA
jgi:hypothetical protein